jgi:hypothetical protein
MENKLPTARSIASGEAEAKRMVEFAKLHVQAALKAASENAKIEIIPHEHEDTDYYINEDSILNAYPLDQIK